MWDASQRLVVVKRIVSSLFQPPAEPLPSSFCLGRDLFIHPPLLLLLVLHTSAQLFRFSPLFLFSYKIIEATKVNTYSQLKKILTDNKRKYLLPPLITPSLTRSTHFVNIFILYFAHDPPYPLKYNFNHFSLLEMNPIPTKVKSLFFILLCNVHLSIIATLFSIYISLYFSWFW